MALHTLNYRHALLLFQLTAGRRERKRLGHRETESGRSEVSIFGNSCLFLSVPILLLLCYCRVILHFFQQGLFIRDDCFVILTFAWIQIWLFSNFVCIRSSVGGGIQLLYIRNITKITSSNPSLQVKVLHIKKSVSNNQRNVQLKVKVLNAENVPVTILLLYNKVSIYFL